MEGGSHRPSGDRSPPIPSGAKTVSEFAQRVMKWGRGNAEARARIGTITREEMMNAGVSHEIAESWRDFYVNEMGRNPANPSAAGRADLMQYVMDLLSSGGP